MVRASPATLLVLVTLVWVTEPDDQQRSLVLVWLLAFAASLWLAEMAAAWFQAGRSAFAELVDDSPYADDDDDDTPARHAKS